MRLHTKSASGLGMIIAFSLLVANHLSAQEPQSEWCRKITGEWWNMGYSVAVDANGNTYVMGFFTDSVDFDPGPDEFFMKSPGHDPFYNISPSEIFVQKLDSLGGFVWVRSFGGSGYDGSSRPAPPPFPTAPYAIGGSVVVDNIDNIYLSGVFFSDTVDIDPGENVRQCVNHVATGFSSDYMVVKLTPDGSFLWGYCFGGAGNDRVDQCRVDDENNIGDFY